MDAVYEVLPYVGFFLVAAGAGLSRFGRDQKKGGPVRAVSVAAHAGFFALGVVCLGIPAEMQVSPIGLGVAAISGLAGDTLSQLGIERMLEKYTGRAGSKDEDDK